MFKYTCLVVCVVAVSISGVYGFSSEERKGILEAVTPIVTECSKEHGVSLDEIKAAQKANNEESLNSCFLECAFKKAGLMNAQGFFNTDTALEVVKKFVQPEDFVKYQENGKNCGTVNDEAVIEASCDRAKLVLDCLFRKQGVELVLS